MAVSYNGLWKLLIDKNMKKVDMMNLVGISSSTVAKMTNGEEVSMKVLEKVCEKLECDFGDIVHYEKEIKLTRCQKWERPWRNEKHLQEPGLSSYRKNC